MEWINLKENPNNTPTIIGWYVCKIKSSDDLRLEFGIENITPDKYDGYAKVDCPL